jgi:putative transposase
MPALEKSQEMCLARGYDFDEVREPLATFRSTAHIRARGEEVEAIKREAAARLAAGWSSRHIVG